MLPNVAITMYNGATSFPLIAIPLFILSGAIMNASGISRRLIAFASALLGWIRGGLAMVSIGTSLFFAEISGSAVADAAALGSILIPAMKSRGYSKEFAAVGHLVVGDARGHHPAVDPDAALRGDRRNLGGQALRLRHRARHSRRLRHDGRRLLVRAPLQLSGRAVVPLGQRAQDVQGSAVGVPASDHHPRGRFSAASSPRPRARRSRCWRRCSSASSSIASSTSACCARRSSKAACRRRS